MLQTELVQMRAWLFFFFEFPLWIVSILGVTPASGYRLLAASLGLDIRPGVRIGWPDLTQ